MPSGNGAAATAFGVAIPWQPKSVETSDRDKADYRDLFEEAPVALIHEGLDSRFIRANRAAVELLGIAPHDVDRLVGLSLVSMDLETRARVARALAALAEGREMSELLKLRRQDGGGPLRVQWRSRPRADGNSTVSGRSM